MTLPISKKSICRGATLILEVACRHHNNKIASDANEHNNARTIANSYSYRENNPTKRPTIELTRFKHAADTSPFQLST
jgi:hypothetical protein